MLGKSIVISLIVGTLTYFTQTTLGLNKYLGDIGGIGSFLVVFGTLYGIMTAFIVVEVWNQHNKTSHLFEQEAEELEKLFRLSLYFRSEVFSKKIKDVISQYGKILITSEFKHLGEGQKHEEEEKSFRQITHVIKDIVLKDGHDHVIFDNIITLYGDLAQTRIERTHQSMLRLPLPLKTFFYASTVIVVLSFVFMPFANAIYAVASSGCLVFMLAMISQIIEELDNPFKGFWNLTPESFEETLLHLEESY